MQSIKKFLPIMALFTLINAIGFYTIYFLPLEGVKNSFVLVVNAMLFTLSFLNYRRLQKMDISRPNQMVQSVMIGTIVKMMVFAVAALVYAKQQKEPVGLLTLLIAMGLYIMYTFFEIQWTLKKR